MYALFRWNHSRYFCSLIRKRQTIQMNLIICTPKAASFVLELTDTTDHVLSVINTKLRSVSFTRSKTTIDEVTTTEKGKITLLLVIFTSKTYANVRKIYYLAVCVKTLQDNSFQALKVALKVASVRGWFRDWIQLITGSYTVSAD